MNTATIRQLVVDALREKTNAGDRVYSPRSWPTVDGDYPCILVQTPFEHKKSLGRNAPQFYTVTTVRVTGRLQEFDGDKNDGAQKAEEQLEQLREQIERAIINSYELTRQTQQYLEVRSQIDIDAGGEGHIAQLLMDFDIEYYQGPEDFYPIESVPLEGVDINLSQPEGTPPHHVNTDLEET